MELIHTIDQKSYDQVPSFDNYTIYHSKEWHLLLKQAFGWRTSAILQKNHLGDLEFFLPVVVKRNIRFKTIYISLPLSHNVPPLFNPGFDSSQLDFSNFGIPRLEVHGCFNHYQFKKRKIHQISILDLSKFKNEMEMFSSLNESSIQRKIKKAQKKNIRITQVNSQKDYNDFFELEVETRKSQGVPIYPFHFFSSLSEIAKTTSFLKLYIARHKDKPVSGVIFSYNKNTATYMYGASLQNYKYLRMGSNQAVMWGAIKAAYFTGIKKIDFGTTPFFHHTLLAYKQKWGATTQDFSYSFYGKKSENSTINRQGPVILITSNILKRMPRKLFKTISPYLLKMAI